MSRPFDGTTSAAFLEAAKSALVPFLCWASAIRAPAIADHFAYKCHTAEEYEHIRRLLEGPDTSQFVYQAIVSGRRIALIRLDFRWHIETALGRLRYLELADQKPVGRDETPVTGFDHVELYPKEGTTVEELMKLLEAPSLPFRKNDRAHHPTFDAKLPGGFCVRLEAEPLIEKIIKTEINAY